MEKKYPPNQMQKNLHKLNPDTNGKTKTDLYITSVEVNPATVALQSLGADGG